MAREVEEQVAYRLQAKPLELAEAHGRDPGKTLKRLQERLT
jgi:hypothetical protein